MKSAINLVTCSALLLLSALSVLPSGCNAMLGYEDGEDHDQPPVDPHAGEVVYQFTVDSDLQLVAFHDDAQGWRRYSPMTTGRPYTAIVTGAYRMLMVCITPSGPSTILISGTKARKPYNQMPYKVEVSCQGAEPAATPFTVRGTMVQPGTVMLGGRRASSQTPGWTFELPAEARKQDLFVHDADRAQVLHDLDVSADLTLPPIDLAQQGTALEPFPLVLTNPIAGESVVATTKLHLVGGTGEIHRGPLPAMLLPGAPYSQTITLISEQHSAGRSLVRTTTRSNPGNGVSSPYGFWVPFEELQWQVDAAGALELTWGRSNLNGLSRLTASVEDAQGRRFTHLVLEGATPIALPKLTFAMTLPGYRPEWRLDVAQLRTREVTMQRVRPAPIDDETFTLEEQLGPTAPQVP